MKEKELVFYNFVINRDLWCAIKYYDRFCRYNTKNIDLPNVTLKQIKKIANKTITYLKEKEYPNIYCINRYDNAPNEWLTLYYMTLTYMYDYYDICPIKKKLIDSNLNELQDACKKTIEWLNKFINEIREPNDGDI